MKKLVLTSISFAVLAQVASAQPAPAPAGEKKPAPAGGGKAMPVPADKVMAPPPADKAGPPKPPEVPAELTAMAKRMAGTWKCTGQAEIMGQMMEAKGTITHRPDPNLNKFWIQSSFMGTAGKLPPMKFTMYTTYDPAAKKLWRVSVNARGGHGSAWGTMTDNKVMWEGEARWPGGVDVKIRESHEMASPKETKILGEYSKDGGKTWSKDHEVTCKK